jgi:phosphonate transport system substrate-binding protein
MKRFSRAVELRITSCMAENADSVCRRITDYVAERMSINAEFVNNIPWQERERLLDEKSIQVGWICGLPYVWKADQAEPVIELLAAPVMAGKRYRNQPTYFSDVVVRSESDFRTFADLRGASFAYNEPRSHSGFNIVRYHLATMGETWEYFGQAVESGAHQSSLRMILNHEADVSAIDSTVLETEIRRQPELKSAIRVIETLGPSPMPPWVILRELPRSLKESLRDLLFQMHRDSNGSRILIDGGIARFSPVDDHFYDAIRHMTQE